MRPSDEWRESARRAGFEDELARDRSMQRFLARVDQHALKNTDARDSLVWLWTLLLTVLCLGFHLGRELGLL